LPITIAIGAVGILVALLVAALRARRDLRCFS